MTRTLEPRKCRYQWCGRTVSPPTPGAGRRAIYCQDACRKADHRYRKQRAEAERTRADLAAKWLAETDARHALGGALVAAITPAPDAAAHVIAAWCHVAQPEALATIRQLLAYLDESRMIK